jgi:hypothetical protein
LNCCDFFDLCESCESIREGTLVKQLAKLGSKMFFNMRLSEIALHLRWQTIWLLGWPCVALPLHWRWFCCFDMPVIESCFKECWASGALAAVWLVSLHACWLWRHLDTYAQHP